MYTFNVIATYEDGEQDIFDIELTDEQVRNQTRFLCVLFQDETKIDSLIKYSVCQTHPRGFEKLLSFLDVRHGKFFFTEEDMDALNIKNRYMRYLTCAE